MDKVIRKRLRQLEPIMLFVSLVVMIFFLYTVYSGDGAQCLANPLVYGVQDFSEANEGTLSCQCALDTNLNTIIEVNTEGWTYKDRSEIPLVYG